MHKKFLAAIFQLGLCPRQPNSATKIIISDTAEEEEVRFDLTILELNFYNAAATIQMIARLIALFTFMFRSYSLAPLS